jgi:hypothetical protein
MQLSTVVGSSFLPVGMMSKCFRTAKSSSLPSGKVIFKSGRADEASSTHSKEGRSAELPRTKIRQSLFLK